MSSLEVLFHVPDQIATGLASGSLQRVGGVIVESTTKQVVAWLRDGAVNQALDVGTGTLPTPLNAVIAAARTGVSLYDSHLTRRAVDGLTQYVQLGTTLTTFAAGGQLLNMAMAAVSFREILRKLDTLSLEIAKVSEVISYEFAKDRDMRFRVALQAARDVFEGKNSDHRDNAMRSAVDGLYEARENFLTEFERLLSQPSTVQTMIAAHHLLIRAMYAEVSRIRCYLAGEEVELAKHRLNEDLPQFAQHSKTLVSKWLGERPAVYFHKAVEAPVLERFLQIQQWLYSDNPLAEVDRTTLLFQIINEMRTDFWNTELIQDEYGPYILNHIVRRPVKTFADRTIQLAEHLNYAEVAAENFDRLLGFDLELRSFRLASNQILFSEWSQLVNEADIHQHGIGIIVDRDQMARLPA